jgi:hypothetical protein
MAGPFDALGKIPGGNLLFGEGAMFGSAPQSPHQAPPPPPGVGLTEGRAIGPAEVRGLNSAEQAMIGMFQSPTTPFGGMNMPGGLFAPIPGQRPLFGPATTPTIGGVYGMGGPLGQPWPMPGMPPPMPPARPAFQPPVTQQARPGFAPRPGAPAAQIGAQVRSVGRPAVRDVGAVRPPRTPFSTRVQDAAAYIRGKKAR